MGDSLGSWGLCLAYFVFIPLEVHPLHWMFGVQGGVRGYGIGRFLDTGLPSVVRFVRRSSRRVTLRPDRKNKPEGRR